MPGQANFLDDISNDLALWIDNTAEAVATAFAPARAPFSANITEQQKLDFYRTRLFNADGSPNAQGRAEELARLGPEGFARVYKAVVAQHPELKPPPEPPIEVPEQWPTMPPGPQSGGPNLPPGPPGPPGAAPGVPPGPPGLMPPPGPPRPPMMPPLAAR